MSFKIFGVTVKIHFLFTAVVSLLLAVDRYSVVPYSLLSVAIHEAGHLSAMLMLKEKPKQIYLCPCGVVIDSNALAQTAAKTIIIALGGPLFNLLPALFLKSSTFKTAMLVNGIFNLLPTSCTDGGDIVDCLLQRVKTEWLKSAFKVVINIVFIAVTTWVGVSLFFKSYNPTLIVASIYMLIMLISGL
ncbi:MAG: hypothetical protein IJF58_02485 [Clostridia bacterium]|nr:hypothetical protein [Clostridia bacterium]